MLWVVKRTVSMRRFFWAHKTYILIDGQENNDEFKGDINLKACESHIQALIKPCNLPQTQSKSHIK